MPSRLSGYKSSSQVKDELALFVGRAEEGRWAEEQGRSFSADERRKAAKEGAALPDGSYPIYNQGDLDNAARLAGKGDAAEATVKAHAKKRAKQLGLKLPAAWSDDS